jgi:hypothetical protein
MRRSVDFSTSWSLGTELLFGRSAPAATAATIHARHDLAPLERHNSEVRFPQMMIYSISNINKSAEASEIYTEPPNAVMGILH